MSGVDPATDGSILVAVVRTGGIAGIRRTWEVEAPAPDTARWRELIDRCPWEEDRATDAGADRYVWHIRARTPERECEREVSDAQLEGPWRALVDAVRAAQR